MRFLEKYKGKKVAVLYSGGLDSGLLAHHLLHGGADEVALLMFDCDMENNPNSQWFNPNLKADFIPDIWQYHRYAKILQNLSKKPYHMWTMRTPELNSVTVEPHNLKPSEIELTRQEESKTLVFYSGFTMVRFSQALAVASKYGFDYIVTGHMSWNVHYSDESLEFAQEVQQLFTKIYGSRLKKIPQIKMPYRENGLSKIDLIRENEKSLYPLPYNASISCNVSMLKYDADGNAINFFLKNDLQVHCGKCLHCLDRTVAFKKAGVVDTAFYAEQVS